jgi:hypothetical protein
MAASKVVTLVITLFLVIVGGMYLLYLPGFSEMLILASAILLARLDLVRLKVWPPNLLALLGFTAFIIFFITYGEMMHLKLHSWPLIKYLINVIVVGG